MDRHAFMDVCCANEEEAWVAGLEGLILKTEDAGKTWIEQSFFTTDWLQSIYFADENNGWTAGSGGVILHTINSGYEWISQQSNYEGWLESIFFINESNGGVDRMELF